jgi:hypothetical protein
MLTYALMLLLPWYLQWLLPIWVGYGHISQYLQTLGSDEVRPVLWLGFHYAALPSICLLWYYGSPTTVLVVYIADISEQQCLKNICHWILKVCPCMHLAYRLKWSSEDNEHKVTTIPQLGLYPFPLHLLRVTKNLNIWNSTIKVQHGEDKILD